MAWLFVQYLAFTEMKIGKIGQSRFKIVPSNKHNLKNIDKYF